MYTRNSSINLFFLLLFIFPVLLNAQEPAGHTLTGSVLSVSGLPVSGASVNLLRQEDEVLVKAELTNEQGIYRFEQIAEGNYLIVTEHSEFAAYRTEPVSLKGNLSFATIYMDERSAQLDEVAITVQRPFIEQQFDKTVLNVDKSISNAGNTALEVLEKAPGIVIDQNDNISMRGRAGVIVMIDGKPVPMSGPELANMLRSMPSNSVDRIELITNPSAKYDAAGNAGIIDLKLKKDNRIGTNGSLTSTVGMGKFFKTTQGVQLNHRNRKINIFGNYNYANRKEFTDLDIYRQFYTNEELTGGYDQQNRFEFTIKSHNARVGVDYDISPNTIIGFSANGIISDFDRNNNNRSLVLDEDLEALSYFLTQGSHGNQRPSGGLNLNFKHMIDTTGREITADLDYIVYSNSDLQDYRTTYFDLNNDPTMDPYLLHGALNGDLKIRSAKADYTHPFPSIKGKLEAGIKSSLVDADNDLKFFDRSNGGNELDEDISNRFLYSENINAAYLNLNTQGEKFSAQLGLRIENTNAEGDQVTTGEKFKRNYTQLFPSGFVGYKLNDYHDFGLSLSRRINRPTYNQLNPFKVFLDASTYSAGNPFLNPELSYALEFTHTLMQKFVMKYSYSHTEDVILNVLSLDPNQEQVVVQTNLNLAKLDYYGVTLTAPIRIGSWFNSVNNGTLYYALYRGNLANTNLDNGRPSFNLNSNNTFNLSETWSAEVIGQYRSREIYGFLDVEPLWSLSAGVQKQLWDKKGSLKLNISDAFYTQKVRARTELTGYTESFYQVRDSRVVNLSFSYRFGQSQVAPARRRDGGAEEEKSRVGG